MFCLHLQNLLRVNKSGWPISLSLNRLPLIGKYPFFLVTKELYNKLAFHLAWPVSLQAGITWYCRLKIPASRVNTFGESCNNFWTCKVEKLEVNEPECRAARVSLKSPEKDHNQHRWYPMRTISPENAWWKSLAFFDCKIGSSNEEIDIMLSSNLPALKGC